MTKDAKQRKETPIYSGVLKYFPEAIKEVAKVSFVGNEQHNPGKPLHWDRSKSGDELDALSRHLMDAGTLDSDGVRHSAKVAWRALANLQKEIERESRVGADIAPHENYDEDLVDKRMNVIGQNGNTGSHYSINHVDVTIDEWNKEK